eukprot:Pgem_evm1s16962
MERAKKGEWGKAFSNFFPELISAVGEDFRSAMKGLVAILKGITYALTHKPHKHLAKPDYSTQFFKLGQGNVCKLRIDTLQMGTSFTHSFVGGYRQGKPYTLGCNDSFFKCNRHTYPKVINEMMTQKECYDKSIDYLNQKDAGNGKKFVSFELETNNFGKGIIVKHDKFIEQRRTGKTCFEHIIELSWDKNFLGIGAANSKDKDATFQFYLIHYDSNDQALLSLVLPGLTDVKTLSGKIDYPVDFHYDLDAQGNNIGTAYYKILAYSPSQDQNIYSDKIEKNKFYCNSKKPICRTAHSMFTLTKVTQNNEVAWENPGRDAYNHVLGHSYVVFSVYSQNQVVGGTLPYISLDVDIGRPEKGEIQLINTINQVKSNKHVVFTLILRSEGNHKVYNTSISEKVATLVYAHGKVRQFPVESNTLQKIQESLRKQEDRFVACSFAFFEKGSLGYGEYKRKYPLGIITYKNCIVKTNRLRLILSQQTYSQKGMRNVHPGAKAEFHLSADIIECFGVKDIWEKEKCEFYR